MKHELTKKQATDLAARSAKPIVRIMLRKDWLRLKPQDTITVCDHTDSEGVSALKEWDCGCSCGCDCCHLKLECKDCGIKLQRSQLNSISVQ